MTTSIAFDTGYAHGKRKQPSYSRLFSPVGSWEDQQYRQGYIAGMIWADNDIAFAKEKYDQRNRHQRLASSATR